MAEFRCDGQGMNRIREQLEQIRDILEDTYVVGRSVQTEIESEGVWQGEAQKTMAAFMDILVQYHKDLGHGGCSPINQAIEGLGELQVHLGGFYDSWPEWREIQRIC